MINNNLMGSINCFEFCRKRNIPIIFLSTSRVYPYDKINDLEFLEKETRFEYNDSQRGVSRKGISKGFTLDGFRSLYGATKLSSEFILREYSRNYSLPSIINRCGVIAGPWQLGKVDQGVFTFWIANHYFKKDLRYIGFGGKGKQVRDLLHIDDLIKLIQKQINVIQNYRGEIFNVGGSTYSSLSLLETTELCGKITGNKIDVSPDFQDRPGDVIWFITDNEQTEEVFNWKPTKKPEEILKDIFVWLNSNEKLFTKLMGK
jgi:CDP-paratose 2-epimerase